MGSCDECLPAAPELLCPRTELVRGLDQLGTGGTELTGAFSGLADRLA